MTTPLELLLEDCCAKESDEGIGTDNMTAVLIYLKQWAATVLWSQNDRRKVEAVPSIKFSKLADPAAVAVILPAQWIILWTTCVSFPRCQQSSIKHIVKTTIAPNAMQCTDMMRFWLKGTSDLYWFWGEQQAFCSQLSAWAGVLACSNACLLVFMFRMGFAASSSQQQI